MWINFLRTVKFSTEIINAGTNQAGLITCGQKTTSGAPAATANKYIAGCIIQNTATGVCYINRGTSASPVWGVIDTGAGVTLPFAGTDATSTTGSVFSVVASALTTGVGFVLTAAALTTGQIYRAVATAATMVGAGRYFEANDGATNVFGIGPNGHIHSEQTTAPTIANGTATTIVPAITAGSTDVTGNITSTGTAVAGTIIVTFNKTYTTAPKTVLLIPTNTAAAAAMATTFVTAKSATTFTIQCPVVTAPSWSYLVIA